jgi:ABC-type transport system substrate-binding protein
MTEMAQQCIPHGAGTGREVQRPWWGRRFIGSLVLVGTLTLSSLWVVPVAAQTASAKPPGDLRIAVAGMGNMRPAPWQETIFGKGYMVLLYDFLVGGKADGTPTADNGVAERWEMAPDAKTWTFWLRKGIMFHDGTEITAEDARWSLENVIKPDSVAAFGPQLRDIIEEINGVYRGAHQTHDRKNARPYVLSRHPESSQCEESGPVGPRSDAIR